MNFKDKVGHQDITTAQIIEEIIEKSNKTNKLLIELACKNGDVSDICKIKIADIIKNLALTPVYLENIESQLNVIKQIIDLNNEILQHLNDTKRKNKISGGFDYDSRIKKMLTKKQRAHHDLVEEILEKGIDYKKLLNDPEYEERINLVTPVFIYSEPKSLDHFRNLKMGQTI